MTADPEIQAMTKVSAALDGLDEIMVARVLRWASDRYNVGLGPPRPMGAFNEPTAAVRADEFEPADIHELFGQAELRTDQERALLVAFWFQHHQKTAAWTGQQINSELKQMGFGASNITHVLNRLMNQRPALTQQVSKSGRSKQARKKYRLTRAGLVAARGLLGYGPAHEEPT